MPKSSLSGPAILTSQSVEVQYSKRTDLRYLVTTLVTKTKYLVTKTDLRYLVTTLVTKTKYFEFHSDKVLSSKVFRIDTQVSKKINK